MYCNGGYSQFDWKKSRKLWPTNRGAENLKGTTLAFAHNRACQEEKLPGKYTQTHTDTACGQMDAQALHKRHIDLRG